jgi:predicted kinase
MQNKIIIVVFGLPGSGKSYFAEALAGEINAKWINSDIVRHEMSGEGQYGDKDKSLIYQAMGEKAREVLTDETPVILDATFFRKALRQDVIDLGKEMHAQVVWMEIVADEELIRQRTERKRKYSEADFKVYHKVKDQFEPLKSEHLTLKSGESNLDTMLATALTYLRTNYGFKAD